MSSATSAAKPVYLKRDELVGKSVVSSTASVIGTVKDLVATPDGKVGLHVDRKLAEGTGTEEVIISSEEIQAMGDVILLKPAVVSGKAPSVQQPMPPPFPSVAPQGRTCGRCGYVNGASSKFCIKCGMSLQ